MRLESSLFLSFPLFYIQFNSLSSLNNHTHTTHTTHTHTHTHTHVTGIVPGSYVYTQCGQGLSAALGDDSNEDETLTSFLARGLFNEHTFGAFALLACWASFLLLLKSYLSKKKRQNKAEQSEKEEARREQELPVEEETKEAKKIR